MNLKTLSNWVFNRSERSLLLTAFVGYLVFFQIIIFVFLPTEALIDATGYTIVHFQQAWTPNQMDLILTAWSANIQSVVIYQLWADLIFILSGFLGNASLLLYFSRKISGSWKGISWNNLTTFGFWIILISHTSDAVENIFGFLIIYNHKSYFTFFVPAQSLFYTVKFITLPIL